MIEAAARADAVSPYRQLPADHDPGEGPDVAPVASAPAEASDRAKGSRLPRRLKR